MLLALKAMRLPVPSPTEMLFSFVNQCLNTTSQLADWSRLFFSWDSIGTASVKSLKFHLCWKGKKLGKSILLTGCRQAPCLQIYPLQSGVSNQHNNGSNQPVNSRNFSRDTSDKDESIILISECSEGISRACCQYLLAWWPRYCWHWSWDGTLVTSVSSVSSPG